MAKPKTVNSQFKKVLTGIKNSDEGINGLIELIGSEDWVENLLEFKNSEEKRKSKTEPINQTVNEVNKILNRYNDNFHSIVLKIVKNKENELKDLGIINKFKS